KRDDSLRRRKGHRTPPAPLAQTLPRDRVFPSATKDLLRSGSGATAAKRPTQSARLTATVAAVNRAGSPRTGRRTRGESTSSLSPRGRELVSRRGWRPDLTFRSSGPPSPQR